MPEFLSVRETAELLGVCTKTIRKRLADGSLVGVRIGEGKAWRIPRVSIAALLAQGVQAPAVGPDSTDIGAVRYTSPALPGITYRGFGVL